MSGSLFVINDLVGLPIIISDWEVTTDSKQGASNAAENPEQQETEGTAAADESVSSVFASSISDYVDSLWYAMCRMTKQTVRNACVEVLRKTDDAIDESLFEHVDDDARLLD